MMDEEGTFSYICSVLKKGKNFKGDVGKTTMFGRRREKVKYYKLLLGH